MLICHTRPKNVRYEGEQGAREASSLALHGGELAWRRALTSTCAHARRNIEESTVPRPQEVEAMQTQLL